MGKRKIGDRWEDEVYVVVGKSNADIPVYEVEAGGKGKRMLHRNLSFPINTIPARDDLPFLETRGKVFQSRQNNGDTIMYPQSLLFFPQKILTQRQSRVLVLS